MKVSVVCDHAGVELAKVLKEVVTKKGHELVLCKS